MNQLRNYEHLQTLSNCPSLSNLNLSNNYIQYHPDIINIFINLPNLACLYLKGNNDYIRSFSNYRKTLIAKLSNLKYLDDRPVNHTERQCIYLLSYYRL